MTLIADKCKIRSCNGTLINGLFCEHGDGCGGNIWAKGWLAPDETGFRLAQILRSWDPQAWVRWWTCAAAWISSHRDPWRSSLRTTPCVMCRLHAGGFLLCGYLFTCRSLFVTFFVVFDSLNAAFVCLLLLYYIQAYLTFRATTIHHVSACQAKRKR